MSVTLARLTTEFLQRDRLTKGTIKSYEAVFIPLLQKYGSHPVREVTKQDLLDYLDRLTHLSYTTHQRHQATLSALFNFAIERDYIDRNPLANVRRKKPNREKGEHLSDNPIRYLKPEQVKLLYETLNERSAKLASGERIYPISIDLELSSVCCIERERGSPNCSLWIW